MQATQASVSVPVEVSWSPPSGGAATITGYRIFYGHGLPTAAPSYVTRIILLSFLESLDDSKVVFIRSESVHLPSELISVVITGINLDCSLMVNNSFASSLAQMNNRVVIPLQPHVLAKLALQSV